MAIVSWVNGAAGDWSTPTNWIGASVPTSADTVNFNQSSYVIISTKVSADYANFSNSTVTINGVQGALTLSHDLSIAGSSMVLLTGGALTATTFLGDANHANAIFGYGALTGDLDTAHAMSVYASGGKLVYSGKFSSDDTGFIGDNATLELVKDPGDAGSKIYLLGVNATLKLDAPTAFTSQILDFDIGDKLDLAGLNVTSASYDGATLSVTTSTKATYTYSLSGQLANTAVRTVSDGAGGSNISFTSLAPGFTSATSATVAENAAITTAVYTAKATSPSPTAKLTYSISGGQDANKFDIVAATGVVTFKASPNYEAPTDAGADNVYNIIVQASDGSLSSYLPVAITVTNVNEAPSVTSVATATVAENFLATTPVYQATGTDPDANAALAWTLAGADAAQFNIDKLTGAVTFKTSPNFEAPLDAGKKNVYTLILNLSDGSLSAPPKTVTISVTNVNEFSPTITSPDVASVAENILPTAAVYTVKGADADTGTTLIYDIVGGADAALFAINKTTGVVTFNNSPNFEAPSDANANNVYDLIVSASDGSTVTTKSVTISVTNVNEYAPIINSAATATAVENTPISTPVYTVTGADADANTTLTYSISSGADAALFNIDKNTGAVTFKASPNFEAPSSAAKTNTYSLIVQASDGTLTKTQPVTITVTDVAEAPSITSAATVLKPENSTSSVYTMTGIDPDAGTVLRYYIAGGADDHLFYYYPETGEVFFNWHKFTNGPDFENPQDADANNVYEIIVEVSDGITPRVTRAVAITISNLNEAAAITSGPTASTPENVSRLTTIYQAAATDPDAGTKLTWSIASGADASFFNINATTGAVSFKSAPNFEVPMDAGMNNVYNLIVRASDGQVSTDKAVAITVTDVAEPSIEAVSFLTTSSNATGAYPVAVAVGELDSGGTLDLIIANAGSDKISVLLGNGDGTFKSQTQYSAGASPRAISVADLNGDGKKDLVVINATGGFSVLPGNGDGSFKAPAAYATSIQSNALVIADMNGDGELDVVTANAPSGGVSVLLGSGAGTLQAPLVYATGSNPLSIVVADFDRDGVMDIATANSGSNDVSILLGHGDGTFDDQTTYPVGSNPVSFALADFNRDGVLDLVTANKGDHSISVLLGNGDGIFHAGPSVSVGSDLTSVSATDINGDGFADVLVGDLTPFDNVWVLLGDGNGEFQPPSQYTAGAYPGGLLTADFNRDGKRDIVVVNQGGNSASVLINGGTAPSIISGPSKDAADAVSTATPVYTVTASDPDTCTTLTYSIAGGVDANRFNINSTTGAVTFKVSPSFLAPSDSGGDNGYNLVVKASDGVLWSAKAIEITVVNGSTSPDPVNMVPAITSNGTAIIAENILPTAGVYTVSATDPEMANLSFSIIGGADASLFNINGSTGELTFKAAPNFEAPSDAGANNVYDIIVRASDGSVYADKAVAISVSNVKEAPILTSASAAIAAENVSTSMAVYTAAVAHPDAGATLTYAIAGGTDASLFNINPMTGAVTFKASPNFEAPTDFDGNNVYDIIVQVSDGINPAVTRAVGISVTNVNEAPSLTSATTATTAENVSTSQAVYTVAATDPDAGATLTYAISGGADASLFTIDPTTGAVTFKASPNFESAKDGGANNIYDIIVQASDGTTTSVTRAVAISVTNVNEAPTLTSAGTATTVENVSTSQTVYTVAATDPDAGATLTYAISGGADASLFNINPTTGAVTFKASPNFEAPTDFGANNVYDIIVQASDNTAIPVTRPVAIAVTNVNEAPTLTAGGTWTTAENVSTSQTVYTATATDPDAGATLSYAISGGADASLFNINPTTGAVTFKASPNFEAPTDFGANNVYDIVVSASDGSLTGDKSVAITVINVDEGFFINSAAAASTPENVSTVTAVYTATANGLAGGATALWSITPGGDSNLFNINAATGAVTFKTSPNFEAPLDAGADNVYNISVHAISGSQSTDANVAITVTNVVEIGNPALTLGKDFNSDGKTDILFQNATNGVCYVWGIDGLTIIEGAHGQVGPAVGADWRIKATGDFNGDGMSDFLFQNANDGRCYIWELDGLNIIDRGHGQVGPAIGLSWQVKDTGDFNGDGKSDILFQNSDDGSCYIWELDGLMIINSGYGLGAPAQHPTWEIKATGDFNGDGKSDVLFQSSIDGSCYIWQKDGLQIADGIFAQVGPAVGTVWQASATGDFNGDGKSDILFHNANDGSCYIWEMNGRNIVDAASVGSPTGTDWDIKGTGDFNRDGKSDILFQNVRDGACYIWELDGLALKTAGYGQVGPAVGTDWHVMA